MLMWLLAAELQISPAQARHKCLFGCVLHWQELRREEGGLLLAAVLGSMSEPSAIAST